MPVEINISLSLDEKKTSRSVYSLLDFLGDIGGLFGALNAIFGGIVITLQFNGLLQYITPNMYKVKQKKTAEEKFKNKKNKKQYQEDGEEVFDIQKLMERKMQEEGSIH